MPGQVTHFYLAARIAHDFPADASDDVMPCVRKGIRDWISANNTFTTGANAAIKANDGSQMQDVMNTYRATILNSEDIGVFSAFAAGAVGPDLWTFPNSVGDAAFGDFIRGSWYFDMGHYNLSHAFPFYTLWQIKCGVGQWKTIQRKYRTAYILGYISHISLDILGHLDVNVFAGAYHQQQQKVWKLDDPPLIASGSTPFNNHNKIEQYWDSLIRFLCFEGYHPEIQQFKQFRINDFGQKEDWNFPNYTNYWSKHLKFGTFIKTDGIYDSDAQFLDLSTSLAGPFAQLYKSDDPQRKVDVFIREYFYNAYSLVDPYISANQVGSLHPDNVPDEKVKLEFFYLEPGFGWMVTQDAYLKQTIPSLQSVVTNSSKFFDIAGLGRFISGAIPLATSFISSALEYIKGGDDVDKYLKGLRNWNLDIGMAYRFKKLESPDPSGPKSNASTICIDLESVLAHPSLSSWSVPMIDENKWINKSAANKLSWTLPNVQPLSDATAAKTISAKAGDVIKVQVTQSLTVQIRLKNTCFYASDTLTEIGAVVHGVSKNHAQPYVINDDSKNHLGISGYHYMVDKEGWQCIENFAQSNDSTTITDGTLSSRSSRTYFTEFKTDVSSLNGSSGPSKDNKFPLLSSVKRQLARHNCCTPCRKWVNYPKPNENGHFEPEKNNTFQTIYPAEDMSFSVFALIKKDDTYIDAFYNDSFTQEQVDSLKHIKVIGVNCILLLFALNEKGIVELKEVYLDGELQIVEKEIVTPPVKPPVNPPVNPPVQPPNPVYGMKFEDVLFRTDSAVMLPDDYNRTDHDSGQDLNKGLKAISAVFKHADKTESHQIIVTGHTDTMASAKYNFDLSNDRTSSVLALLEGVRDNWAATCQRRNHSKDIQTILKWSAGKYSWDCDPGEVDGVHGQKTKTALKNFKQNYNQIDEISYKVAETDSINQETWGAVFELYRKEIAGLLGVSYAQMNDKYTMISTRWADLDCKTAGCSEAFPKENPDKDEYECAVNRRMEVFFYDKELIQDKHPLCQASKTAPDLAAAKTRMNTCRAQCAIFTQLPKPQYLDPM